MSSDETTNAGDVTDTGGTDTGTGTPLFDATARALAAAQTADATSASTDTNPEDTTAGRTVGRASEPADTGDTGEEDWVDQGYGDPAKPTPMMDPDTPEGAAILELFRQIKDYRGVERPLASHRRRRPAHHLVHRTGHQPG